MTFKRVLPLIFLFLTFLGLCLPGLKLGLPSETGVLTTLHPDEPVTFRSLERMNPAKLDFFPGDALYWGTFQVYAVGALIKSLDAIGALNLGDRNKLKTDLLQVDKMYLAGRLLSVFFGGLSTVVLYLLGCLLLDRRAAFFAALLLVFSHASVMAASFLRPDSIMLFWGLLSVYFSFKLLRVPSNSNCALAGFFLGLACVTKYSAVLFVFFPIAVHIYHVRNSHDFVSGFKKIGLFCIAWLASFLAFNPYLLLEFSRELQYMSAVAYLGGIYDVTLKSYTAYFLSVLPAAFGWSMVPFGLAAAARWLSGPAYEKRIIAVYCTLFLAWAGATSYTYVLYTLLVAPFIFLASGDLAHSLFDKRWGKIIVIAVFAQVLFYTLFIKRNYISDYTIKEADSWIRQNLPEGSTIAISKNYIWTPFVIRRHSGSFKIIEGASSHSIVLYAVVELGKIYSKADYVVISEKEYAAIKANPEKYAVAYAALEKIFSGTKEVKRFEKKLPFYVLPFDYNDRNLVDLNNLNLQVNFMNPDIRVLKVIKK